MREQPNVFYAAIVATCDMIADAVNKDLAASNRPGSLLTASLMVQAAQETGYCSLGVWQGIEGWRGKNNLSGISPNGQIADFADALAYSEAYASTIMQNAFGFAQVLEAGLKGVPAQLTALGQSQWSRTGYVMGGQPGGALLSIWGTDHAVIEQVVADYQKTKEPTEKAETLTESSTLTTQTQAAEPAFSPQDLAIVKKYLSGVVATL